MRLPNHQVNVIVTHKEKEMGVHGLRVEVWQRGALDDGCIGNTFTNHDGTDRFVFEEPDLVNRIERYPQIYIKIRERNGNIIYSTIKEERTKLSGKTLKYRIALSDKVLSLHLSRPVSWEPPTDRIIPQLKMKQIAAAISLISRPDEPEHKALQNRVSCLRPPIDFFEHILIDAWYVLQGDLNAVTRFREILENIRAQRLRRYGKAAQNHYEELEKLLTEEGLHQLQKTAEQAKGKPKSEEFVRSENAALLMMAALHSAGQDRTTAARYAGIVFDQLLQICRFHPLGALHRAAVSALKGGPVERNHFRDMLEFIDSEFGPDCGPYPPLPVELPNGFLEPVPLPPCVEEAARIWKQDPIPTYVINEVKPSRACPGDVITIFGSGFGSVSGIIRFRKRGSGNVVPQIEAKPQSWSDSQITLAVPQDAGCGLELSIPPSTVQVCGRFFDRHKIGYLEADFEGTAPEIRSFTVNGYSRCLAIEPGEDLEIMWDVCAADMVHIVILGNMGKVIDKHDEASTTGIWKFTGTNVTETMALQVKLVAEGKCQPPSEEQKIPLLIGKTCPEATKFLNEPGCSAEFLAPGADCPPEQIVPPFYPKLKCYKVLEDHADCGYDPGYNCLAWALGRTDADIWPGWCVTASEMQAFLAKKGYAPSKNCDPECGKRKLAIFGKARTKAGKDSCHEYKNIEEGVSVTYVTHIAREFADGGWWSSKLGQLWRIIHRLHELEDQGYGDVIYCMEKAAPNANGDLC